MRIALFWNNVLFRVFSFFSSCCILFRLILIHLVVMFSLAGCCLHSTDFMGKRLLLAPHQVKVAQGNFISRELIANSLYIGMKKHEVRSLFGSPLFSDIFHFNNWYYVFYLTQGCNYVVNKQHLVLYFTGEKLTKWRFTEGIPSEIEFVNLIDNGSYGLKKSN